MRAILRRMAAAVLAMSMIVALARGVAGPDGYFGSGNAPVETTPAQAATA